MRARVAERLVGRARAVGSILLDSLLPAFAAGALAAQPGGAPELLKKADEERTANYPEFATLLATVEKQRDSLPPDEREHLQYLQAWKSAYDGDTQTALARLTALIDNSKDPTLRLRAGATAVNMLVFARHYE